MGSLVRDPVLIRGLAAIWRLPVVDLRVPRADANAWSGACFGPAGRDIFSGRLAQAALELPSVEEHYLAGRTKQALRTNLRHARDLGVTSGRIQPTKRGLRLRTLSQWRSLGPAYGQARARATSGLLRARDVNETPLALAGAALFGQFAVLFIMVSHPDRRPGASWARYQLHTCLALDLARFGRVLTRRLRPAANGWQSVLSAPAGLPSPPSARQADRIRRPEPPCHRIVPGRHPTSLPAERRWP